MIGSCREHGLPPPQFREVGTHLRVSLRLLRQSPPTGDPVEARILRFFAERNGLSIRQVAELVSLSPRSARTKLKNLVDRGLIVEIGSTPTDPSRLYDSRADAPR
ncbi:MAG: helix-turn-helix domain-containing protein [Candidatus Eisenbacteria bacterium]|nr:helix-turn-helix domain-containing protein [Candidatus Eisenbacteria bacterium]MCC7143377.1 helix-turn-helix domain-containing protein [Candidatus Eisenbacteria bacterium]